jgi:hypothetical protein
LSGHQLPSHRRQQIIVFIHALQPFGVKLAFHCQRDQPWSIPLKERSGLNAFAAIPQVGGLHHLYERMKARVWEWAKSFGSTKNNGTLGTTSFELDRPPCRCLSVFRSFSVAYRSSKSNAWREATSMVQLGYDVFSGSIGFIPTFVFLVTAITVFFAVCNFFSYCNDRIKGFAITRPLRSLRFFQ